MFIKNIAVQIFSEETLKQCSVTGESSNAYKNSVKRPSLDMKKLNAVREISEYWMRFRKMLEHDIVQHSANVGRYIGQKIACLNRGPRKNLKRKNKRINNQAKKKSKEEISSEDETSPDDEKIMEHDRTLEHFSGDAKKIIQEDDKEPEKDDTDEFDDEIFNTIN
ncbi:uncharacterized protein LOC117181318 [Belonocnema kinseyi]|uniref:uncharacterized protein LOC117181318 n=1 Tax=Belonocnema kinseyi TaxID=2817044 RepID=UPI00143D0AC1|nr:uncharacterized protein LOC117181318 [Belonocnema kinseyi]